MQVKPSGPLDSPLLLVGEAPGATEDSCGIPFSGSSGKLLDSWLASVGFPRSQCRVTNICQFRPPGNDLSQWIQKKPFPGAELVGGRYCHPLVVRGLEDLQTELLWDSRRVVVLLGAWPLWAVLGQEGISAWRGSTIPLPQDPRRLVIPTYHPAGVMRRWEWTSDATADLSKAVHYLTYPYRPRQFLFHIHPTLEEVRELAAAEALAADIETRGGIIDCIGLAPSPREVYVIPFETFSGERLYSLREEAEMVLLIKHLLQSKYLIGMNFLYDAQWIARHWGFLPLADFDVMHAHATMYPGTPKSLAYISSLYLDDYQYWKHERADAAKEQDDAQHWRYNGMDCMNTLALFQPLSDKLTSLGLNEQFQFIQSLQEPVARMMLRGVRIDKAKRSEYLGKLLERAAELESFFRQIRPPTGKTPWWNSPTQLRQWFYEELHIPPVLNKDTKRPTVDDDALTVLARREPILEPLIRRLQEYRSIGVFMSHFIRAKLDHDGRARGSFNLVGTETFRFSCSKDVFGLGMNLQTIPTGDEE